MLALRSAGSIGTESQTSPLGSDKFSDHVLSNRTPRQPRLVSQFPDTENALLEDLARDDSAEVVFQTAVDLRLRGTRPIDWIRDRLDEPAPLTWLFTGTDYGFDAARAKRSFIEFFSDFIKKKANRRLDVFVDSTYAGHSMRSLNQNANWRVTRFLPDVVFLMLGPSDLQRTHADTFAQALSEFVAQLQEERCAVVICTPAMIDATGEQDCADRLDRIQRIAAMNEVALIDNFAYWAATVDSENLPSFISNERLTLAGHQKLTRHMLRSLGLLTSK